MSDREEWIADLVREGYTKRQAQVVVRLREGLTIEEIASDLALSVGTVRAHSQLACDVATRSVKAYLLLYGSADDLLEGDEEVREELARGLAGNL